MRREKRERETEGEKERERETHTEREKESERGRQTHCPKAHPKSRKGQRGRVPCTRFFSIKISLRLPSFRKNVFMHGFSPGKPCTCTVFRRQRKPVHEHIFCNSIEFVVGTDFIVHHPEVKALTLTQP